MDRGGTTIYDKETYTPPTFSDKLQNFIILKTNFMKFVQCLPNFKTVVLLLHMAKRFIYLFKRIFEESPVSHLFLWIIWAYIFVSGILEWCKWTQ